MFGTKVRLTLERAVRRGSWTIWTSWLFNLVDLSHEHDATVVQRITSIPVEISDKLCDQTANETFIVKCTLLKFDLTNTNLQMILFAYMLLLTECNNLCKKWFYKHFTNSFLCKNDFMNILQAIYTLNLQICIIVLNNLYHTVLFIK